MYTTKKNLACIFIHLDYCRIGTKNIRKNKFYSHPCDCAKFIQCYNGRTFIKSCKKDRLFDESITGCNHKGSVTCKLGKIKNIVYTFFMCKKLNLL